MNTIAKTQRKPQSARARTTAILIQLLVTGGGMAALSWEVLWQLRPSLALGISAVGTALTLAATMGGMTAGSLLAGRLLRDRTVKSPLRLYGWLEAAIGISGLSMLPAFALLERIDGLVYAAAPGLASLVHMAGIAVLLGPPTLAMGASIPVFGLLGRSHGMSIAVLYGLNTAGAALGVLVVSFLLVPALGVGRTCLAVAAINLGVFAVSRVLGRGGRQVDSEPLTAEAEPERVYAFPVAATVVFGTGLATFALEVAWFRSLRAAFQSTTDSFALILTSVLVPLAVGARLVPWLRRRGISPASALALAAVAILLATPVVERMDLLARPGGGYWSTVARWILASLLTLGPAMLCLGIPLPWLLSDHPTPQWTGRLYAVNTLGAVVGSLLAAWILLPGLGFARTAWLVGVGVALLAVALSPGWRRWAALGATAAALLVAIDQASSVGRDRVQGTGLHEPVRLVAYEETPDSTVSVVENYRGQRRLMIDGFVTTTEEMSSAHYMSWMGHLPMLLHPEPRRALVICFGTGRTANAVRREGPDRLDIVELNERVLEMAPLFRSNEDVLSDPSVRATVMDGRAWIRRSGERYDVMTLEPMPPNFAGVNSLYSLEFYELMAAHLNPGGIVAQWLPFHLVTPVHALAIAATFQNVFPDSVLWVDPFDGTGILVGRRDAEGAPIGTELPGYQRITTDRTLTREQARQSVLLDPAGLGRYAARGRIITDDNQLLAYGKLEGRVATWSEQAAVTQARTHLEIAATIAGRVPLRLGRHF